MKKTITSLMLGIILVFSIVCLSACDSKTEPTETTKTIKLNTTNYSDYLNMSYTYTYTVDNDAYKPYSWLYNVSFAPLDENYSFSNVVIDFNFVGATNYKLPTNGTATFSVTTDSFDSTAAKIKIKKITGSVTVKSN